MFSSKYHTICYFSDAHDFTKEEDVNELFRAVSVYNNSNNIYGILLHFAGKYLQILEGDKNCIRELYEKIQLDKRHSNIYEVFNKQADSLFFENYSSKFNILKTKKDLVNIQKYLDSNGMSSRSDKLSRLLAPFIMFADAS